MRIAKQIKTLTAARVAVDTMTALSHANAHQHGAAQQTCPDGQHNTNILGIVGAVLVWMNACGAQGRICKTCTSPVRHRASPGKEPKLTSKTCWNLRTRALDLGRGPSSQRSREGQGPTVTETSQEIFSFLEILFWLRGNLLVTNLFRMPKPFNSIRDLCSTQDSRIPGRTRLEMLKAVDKPCECRFLCASEKVASSLKQEEYASPHLARIQASS